MKKITYTTQRLLDWMACIKVGSATVKVHFAGGALTKFGITPAEYTTANPFIQKVIEQSQYFKEGRIKKTREVDVPDPDKPVAPVIQATQAQPPTAPVETPKDKQPADEAPAQEGDTLTEPTAMKQIEASCLQDAQDYLQQEFGIASYKVRTWALAKQVAAEHGVQFVSPDSEDD